MKRPKIKVIHGNSPVKCIAVGDPHFQTSNVPESEMLINQLNTLVDIKKPDFVVILGDTMHMHEKIHVSPLKMVDKLIETLSAKVPVYVLIGNHDYCFAKNTPILLYDGYTKMVQELNIGDTLVGDDSKPRVVKRLVKGVGKKMYKVCQDNGLDYTVTAEHKLTLISYYSKPYFDKNMNKWTSIHIDEDLRTKVVHFDNKKQAETFTSDPFYHNIIDISVSDYLNLPLCVRGLLYGYKKNEKNKKIGINVVESDETEYYGFETDKNHRFLLSDTTVSHNCNNQQFLTDNHGFNAYKKWPNVTIVDKPVELIMNGHQFVFCPYVPVERFEEALNTMGNWKDATCIFAHQEFFGCRFNPTTTSTDGDVWSEENPLVISGHIHEEQTPQSNIYYPGSSMQHGFAESCNKIVAVVEFIPNEKLSLHRIDLQLPKKKTFYIDVENIDDFKIPEKYKVKIVVKGRPEQIKVFRRGITYKNLLRDGVKISFASNFDESQLNEYKRTERVDVGTIFGNLVAESSDDVKKAYSLLMKELK